MMYETLATDFQFYKEDLKLFIPIVLGTIGFIIYWFSFTSEKTRISFVKRYGFDWGSANHVIFHRLLGAVTIGFLPALVYLLVIPKSKLTGIGVNFQTETLFASVVWILGLSLVLVFMSSKNAKKEMNLAIYPQIRAKYWSKKMFIANLLSWAIYLFSYELFFRGLLLFPLVEQIGLWPAIAVNIGLYSATHIPKGLNEAVGAIPLAVVLCLLSVMTGNIWIAVFVHIAMAWSNSLFSLKHHPDMTRE